MCPARDEVIGFNQETRNTPQDLWLTEKKQEYDRRPWNLSQLEGQREKQRDDPVKVERIFRAKLIISLKLNFPREAKGQREMGGQIWLSFGFCWDVGNLGTEPFCHDLFWKPQFGLKFQTSYTWKSGVRSLPNVMELYSWTRVLRMKLLNIS